MKSHLQRSFGIALTFNYEPGLAVTAPQTECNAQSPSGDVRVGRRHLALAGDRVAQQLKCAVPVWSFAPRHIPWLADPSVIRQSDDNRVEIASVAGRAFARLGERQLKRQVGL